MQRVRVPISSFQFGEISDSLGMRTDTPIYAASAERLENMVVMTEGSVKKRTGLKFIYDYGITYSSSNPEQSHLFPYVFDDNEEYIISIEHQKVRCFSSPHPMTPSASTNTKPTKYRMTNLLARSLTT